MDAQMNDSRTAADRTLRKGGTGNEKRLADSLASGENETVRARLNRLERLPHGWDTYGSPPIQECAVMAAYRLLHVIRSEGYTSPTYVGAVPGGGLQFDWSSSGRELEIEILPDGSIECLRVSGDDAEESALARSPDDNEVQASLHWIAGAEH